MSMGQRQVKTERLPISPLMVLVATLLALLIAPSRAEAAPCNVQIKTEPQGASIYVNNRAQGSTPREVKLPDQSAQYKLRLRLRGYEEYKTIISCARPLSNRNRRACRTICNLLRQPVHTTNFALDTSFSLPMTKVELCISR